ncbi:MAG: PAS domain-containing sensor histidine kinase [Gemmatimonadaceae bacterium]
MDSGEPLREIAEAMHDVVALSDASGSQVLFVNSAYERIWGRSAEELYANPLAFLEGVYPGDRERVREAVQRRPRAEYNIEFRVVHPSGDVRWVWTRSVPVRNAAGEIYRMATIAEDITDRKRIVASHQQLVRGFTHDVKNPLGAADGYLSLLEMGVYGDVNPEQAESLGRVRRSIKTALRLAAQLLEIEQAEAGRITIERASVDLAEVTRDTVGEFRASANAKRLTLEVLPPRAEDSLVLLTDAARVRQILANLVSNAVKYTPPDGHITVRAHVADDAEAPWLGHWMAITVADNGPGIPPERQGSLFREFTRFDPGATEGSGIGLAISQQLATALGATIALTSVPGEGSTFTLWLPGDDDSRMSARMDTRE